MDEWMKKMWCVYIYVYIPPHTHTNMEYYSAIKREQSNAILSNMNEPRDYHTKWSKSESQIPYGITYMWNWKCDTNELIYETGADSQM